jgi:hypothetical protein
MKKCVICILVMFAFTVNADVVNVFMGQAVGVNGDSLTAVRYGSWPLVIDATDDASLGSTSALEMIVDMGEVKSVSSILLQNMPADGYAVGEPGDIRVYVADDESAGLNSSFTHEITNGRTGMNSDQRGIANAWETYSLPSTISKRYVKIDITGNGQPGKTLYQFQNMAINAVPASVSMGKVLGVNGDTIEAAHYGTWPQTLNGSDSSSLGNLSACEMIVDMGDVKTVSAILLQNMPDNGYGIGEPGDIRVYVADDESAGFLSSFTHEITNGRTAMTSDQRGMANAWETFKLPSIITKRYIKIDITGNGQPEKTLYQWQDIDAVCPSVWAVDGDTAFYQDGGDPANPSAPMLQIEDGTESSNHNAISYVMDLGSVTAFKSVGILNRSVYQVAGNPKAAKIFVAPDETAAGFNPQDKSSFTVQINVGQPASNTFTGSDTTANEERYIDVLDGYSRQYIMVEITDNSSGPINSVNYFVQFQGVMTDNAHHGISAGALFGLPDNIDPSYSDEPSIFTHEGYQAVRFFYNGGPDGDKRTDIVIDQLTVKDIQKVLFTNWYVENTLENVRSLSMWVAPASGTGSESDPDWETTLKYNKSSYSEQIFPQNGGGEGALDPDVYSKGMEREADVIDVSRRYILMSVKSTFFGNMGEFDSSSNYLYYSSLGDISVLGTDSITDCEEVVRLGLSLSTDLDKNCRVDILDLKELADEWLKCTDPGVSGCVQTADSTPTYSIQPVPTSGITIDGALSDWPSDSEWIYLTDLYAGDYPHDVAEAKMSLRWNGTTDKIYGAVIVDDSEHHFSSTATYTADLIEIYSQGDAAGGTGWGADVDGSKYFDAAQQYFVGHKATSGTWSAWADLTSIASTAGFEAATSVNGNKIIYEFAVKQFNNYGGISGGTTDVTQLTAGNMVGLDVIADTVHDSSLFTMISENMFIGKSNDAAQFQQYELVNSLPERYCGDWGYMAADVSQNCRVNLEDLAIMASQWFSCDDPQDSACTHNW